METAIERQLKARPKRRVLNTCAGIIVVVIVLWSASVIDPQSIKQNGMQIAQNIILGILHPDITLMFNFSAQGVPYLILETICIAFLGTIVGAILAIPFAFLSASNIVPRPLTFLGHFAVMAIRTVPPIIYGLMFIRVSGPGPFAGLLTMSLCSVGMVSKMYTEAIEELDPKIMEPLTAVGCNTFEKIRYGILPQLTPLFLSIVIYRFDMNLRDAAVLGLVGAGGIGAPLIFAMNAYRWNDVGSILIWLIIVVLIVEFFSTKIRVKLVQG